MTYLELPLHKRINYKGYQNLKGRHYGTLPKNHKLLFWIVETARIDNFKFFDKLTTKIFPQ